MEAPKDPTKQEVAQRLVSAMLERAKKKALAPHAPKPKRKRDRKHAAKHIVRKRVKAARQRNRR